MAKKQKYYTVWQGKTTGVFDSWDDCQEQIKGVAGALYKAFDSRIEAETALKGNYWSYVSAKDKVVNNKPSAELVLNSLSVDAACSGNPGIMEYQGVRTFDKERIFHRKFPLGTNNIGEFLALVHGLSYMKKHGFSQPIYSDSVNAIAWVKQKKCKTKLVRTAETEELFQFVERAEAWLQNNTYTTEILKWDTENWGEIPADFNRKK